jgi:hypothetical protein
MGGAKTVMTVKRSSGMLEGTAIDQKYIDLAGG